MDWKNITNTLTPYINKAKEYGTKVAKFAEDQIQTTPLFIKTQSEYENILIEKRVVILAYDETQESIAKEIRLFSSIWLTRAFIDSTTLRFIATWKPTELLQNMGITTPIDMRVRFEWLETFHFTDTHDIKQWWQAPVYTNWDTGGILQTDVAVDPLAWK